MLGFFFRCSVAPFGGVVAVGAKIYIYMCVYISIYIYILMCGALPPTLLNTDIQKLLCVGTLLAKKNVAKSTL